MADRAGFTWNESGHSTKADSRVSSVLYEAAPIDFVSRYPGSRLQDSYGDQWTLKASMWMDVFGPWVMRRSRYARPG
ncbi:MAG: hypothetical protein ACRDPJ_12720 [Nocardioidaceae bacterium]